jgi:hypothetical protein
MATAERVGLDVVKGLFDDIRRDRDETYRALAARVEPGAVVAEREMV